MKPTDISVPDYFHKVVDCQWACPAHTPVPEYIRLIAAGRYSDAYMINWESNVFPGHARPHLRPARASRPAGAAASRRSRSRSAGSSASPPTSRTTSATACPSPPTQKNGKRIALVGGGPASLTVARDLAPLGYECVVFDQDPLSGGMMRTQIPKFRLPENVHRRGVRLHPRSRRRRSSAASASTA